MAVSLKKSLLNEKVDKCYLSPYHDLYFHEF